MYKTFIIGSLILILLDSNCFSQTLSELVPFDLNTPDRLELIKYMTDEIEATYYWKENLVKFYTLKHPVGYVNFAAKSDKGDIYYFVWNIGVVPQLVAAENSSRLTEGKKLAQKRDLEISEAIKKKVQDRIDSLYTTYITYIDTSIILAPPEFKDSLRTLIYDELNRDYKFYSMTCDYDSFKEETDSHIRGSIEGSIKYYKENKLKKSLDEKIKKINQVNSLIYEINEKISFGRLSEEGKKELIAILRKDFINVCPNELDTIESALSGYVWAYKINSTMVVTFNNNNSTEIENAYYKALNLEKIYISIENFLKK